MVAVYGQSNGQRKLPRATTKCPKQKAPILESPLCEDPQVYVGTKERHKPLEVERNFNLWGLVFTQKSPDTGIIVFRRINVAHDVSVSVV